MLQLSSSIAVAKVIDGLHSASGVVWVSSYSCVNDAWAIRLRVTEGTKHRGDSHQIDANVVEFDCMYGYAYYHSKERVHCCIYYPHHQLLLFVDALVRSPPTTRNIVWNVSRSINDERLLSAWECPLRSGDAGSNATSELLEWWDLEHSVTLMSLLFCFCFRNVASWTTLAACCRV